MASVRYIKWQLFIAWDFTTYIDESSRLVAANGEMSFVPPGDGFASGRGIISSMNLTLDNYDARYSPLNSSSSIYSSIQNGKAYHAPCYINVSIDGGSVNTRIFTGVIKWPEINGSTIRETSVATIECRSREELLLQNKTSTTLSDFQSYYDNDYSEADVIEEWLTNAGVVSGHMDIDPGLFVVPWLWLDDESEIEEIWKLAAACGGRFYCTPNGKFTYENATAWLTDSRSTSSQETLDTNDFSSFEPFYDDRDLYSSVLVEASPREIVETATLWEPDETISVLPGQTKTITAKLRQPAYTINDVVYTAVTSGGTNITSSVTITSVNFAQRVEITIANAHATHSALLRPLRVTGRAVSGSPTVEEERNATDNGSNGTYFATRGDRRKSIRGNVYVQTRPHAAMIADYLMRQAEQPRLNYKISGCPGRPLRRLGDRITINDTTIMSASRDALLTKIRWRLDKSGFSQDLEAIDAASLYPYQSTSPGYFVLGTNTLGSSDALKGRLFF